MPTLDGGEAECHSMSIGELKANVFHSRQRPSLLIGDGLLLLGGYFAAAIFAAHSFFAASASRMSALGCLRKPRILRKLIGGALPT